MTLHTNTTMHPKQQSGAGTAGLPGLTTRCAFYFHIHASATECSETLQDQSIPCQAFAEAMGWKFEDEHRYVDHGRFGEKRPALKTLTRAAFTDPPPFQVVIVEDFSFLFYDTTALSQFKRMFTRNGVRIVSVSEELRRCDDGLAAKVFERVEHHAFAMMDPKDRARLERKRRRA